MRDDRQTGSPATRRVSVAQYSVGGRSVPDGVVEAILDRMRAAPFDMAALCETAREAMSEHLLPTGTAHMVVDKVVDRARRDGCLTKIAADPKTKKATWSWGGV